MTTSWSIQRDKPSSEVSDPGQCTLLIECSLYKTTVPMHKICTLAEEAREKIMQIYNAGVEEWKVQYKGENDPVTAADLCANQILCNGLNKICPSIPIISEENQKIPYNERNTYSFYWVVDPLDGTKEFLKRSQNFTVNVALCCEEAPIAGVVVDCGTGVNYVGIVGFGAFKKVENKWQRIKVTNFQSKEEGLRIMVSSSHPTLKLQEFLKRYNSPILEPAGSSIKIVKVAEGYAQLYPRLGPTCEWDTCAAHAVVKAAGGDIYEIGDDLTVNGSITLRYNKESSYNPFFIVCGNMKDLDK